ncbi:hypothetical protein Hanom_Chr00s156519g01823801 [Helianthus anomalus]
MERFFYFNFMSRIMSDYKVEMINDGMQKSYVHFHRFNLWNVRVRVFLQIIYSNLGFLVRFCNDLT